MIRFLVGFAIFIKAVWTECLQGCRICSPNNACMFCDFELNYALVGTNCRVYTLPNCTLMDPVGTCLICANNYYLDPFTTNCITLPSSGTLPNCLQYSGQQQCTLCATGFYVLNGNCVAVPNVIPNCQISNSIDPTKCQLCKQGMVLDQDRSNCLNVTTAPNCAGYSVFKCNSCADGYLLDMNMNLSSAALATTASSRFYIEQQFINDKSAILDQGVYSTCNPIIVPNCQTYINVNNCSVCNPGYYLQAGQCVMFPKPVILNCQIYLNQIACLQCLPGYYLISPGNCTLVPVSTTCKAYDPTASTTICVQCLDAFFLNSDKICQTRSVSQNILNCAALNLTADTCRLCISGYQITDDQLRCLPLVQNCAVYAPSSSTTAVLQCNVCITNYVLVSANNTCNLITISNCLSATFSNNQVNCIVCANQYYVSNGLCAQQPTIGNCSLYSQSGYNSCSQCMSSYFLFIPSNVCQQSTYIQSCIQYQSSSACAVCKDGFQVVNGMCLQITSIPNCLQITNNMCSKCQTGYMITSYNGFCQPPPDYFNMYCVSNNINGIVTEANIVCSYCVQNSIPLIFQNNYQCALLSTIPVSSQIANCDAYQFTPSQSVGGIGSYACTSCAPTYFLDVTTGNCVLNCTLVTAAPYHLPVEISNLIPASSSSYTAFQIGRTNVCVNGNYAGCRFIFPDLFVHTINSAVPTYICGACLSNYMPVILPSSTVYFNTSYSFSSNSANFATLTAQSPVRTFPGVTCALTQTFYSAGTTSAVVANCEYYFNYATTFYGCYRCIFGYTGPLTNPAGTVTAGTVATVSNCLTQIPNCQASFDYDIFVGNKSDYAQFTVDLGALYSCKLCSIPTMIPYIAIDLTGGLNQIPKYVLYSMSPGNGRYKATYASNSPNPSIFCASSVAGSFGITNSANFFTVANCGLGVLNVGSLANALTAALSNPVNDQTAVYCYACAPGYLAVRVTPPVSFAPMMVWQCNQIQNCATSTWFNACSNCVTGASYLWDSPSQQVRYDVCVVNTINNCFAVDPTGNPIVCIICNQGYTLNRDGQCEQYTTPYCQDPSVLLYRNFSLNANSDQHLVGLYMLSSGLGCQSCSNNYVGYWVNTTYCAPSPYLASNPSTVNATTFFTPLCTNWGWDSSKSKIVCMVCVTGYIRSTNGGCVTALPFCTLANVTNAPICVTCAAGYINVGGNCQTQNIANCQVYSDTSQAAAQKCATCNPGFYPSGSQCVSGSVPNCLTYASQYKCLQCAAYYAVVTNSATGVSYCYPLPQAQNCLYVDSTFQTGSLTCITCASGYAISTTLSLIPPTLCLPIVQIPNCNTYQIDPVLTKSVFNCSSCVTNYYLVTSANSCALRTINFRQCQVYNVTADLCSQCIAGFYLSNGNTTCTQYPTGIVGCIEYSSALNCTQCDVNLFFNGTWCNPVPTNQLVKNCTYYKDAKTCNLCQKNFALVSNQCLQSSATNCLTWASTTACGSCYSGFGFQTTSGIRNCVEITDKQCITYQMFFPFSCSLCQPGFYPLNGVCTAVNTTIQFCIIYDSPNTCLQCDPTSVLNTARTLCLKTLGYFSYFDPNCNFMTILSSPVCNKCQPNYYFLNNTCTLCPNATMNQGCYYCNPLNVSNCLACKTGYYQKIDGTCISNTYVPPNNTNSTANNTTNTTNKTNFTSVNNTIPVLWADAFAIVLISTIMFN